MHAFSILLFPESGVNADLDSLQPLPPIRPHNPRNVSKPPSMVYTSPESLQFIKSRDKDAEEDFDRDSPVTNKKKKKTNSNLKRKLQYTEAPRSKRKAAATSVKKVVSIADFSTDDSDESEDPLPPPPPNKRDLGRKNGKLPLLKQQAWYKCGICKLKASKTTDFLWVHCPVCILMSHKHCLQRGCMCGFEPKPRQLTKKK